MDRSQARRLYRSKFLSPERQRRQARAKRSRRIAVSHDLLPLAGVAQDAVPLVEP